MGDDKTVRFEVESLGAGEETMRTQGIQTGAFRGEAPWDTGKKCRRFEPLTLRALPVPRPPLARCHIHHAKPKPRALPIPRGIHNQIKTAATRVTLTLTWYAKHPCLLTLLLIFAYSLVNTVMSKYSEKMADLKRGEMVSLGGF